MKSTFLVLVFLSFSLLCFSQDIVVTGVSGNQTFEQSTALTATATFKNEGIVTTASFSIRAVLSSDQTIDSNDHSLYASSNISLAPGESKTVDLKSFTSANAPVGNYYLIIKADEYNSVSETDETNNILITSGYSVIPGNVDLIFQSCTLDPSTIGRFGGTTVHYTIVNTGTTSLYKRVWTTFYLSSDNVLSGDDTKLDFRISNPVSNQITANLSLPLPNVAVGNYYILGAVDNTTSVKELTTETDETNNVVAVPLTITAPNIDLELSEFRNLIYMNGMFTFDFTIRNNGTTAVYIDLDDITLWADYMPLPPPSGIIGRVINPGETQYYYAVNVFYFNSGTVNKYTLHVNESRSITEVNYNNNSLEFGIVFDPPDPIVNVTAASWAGTFYQTDTELSIEATFSNIGESYYTHYPLAFKITNSLGQIVHTDYEYFSDSYFESGGTRTRQYNLTLVNPLPAGNYTVTIDAANRFTLPLTIHPPQFSLSGTIQDDTGTPITKGKLFLYQKKDNGIVQFIDQIENTASHLFDFDLDYRDYTLYFIPDRTAFPDHLPTVFGKTLMLEESSYFHLRDDSTVVMKVLKVSPPASGSSFISGTISQGNPGGRMRAAGVTSVTVILLDAQGNPVGITTSDETGYFIFENLAPGEYQLAVTADPDQPIAHEPYQVDISTANARVELTLSEEGISGSTERVLYIQSISFDALDAKTFGDDPFQLEATSSSGLPVTYSSSNTDIAVVDGAQVTILHAGTVAITATQAGNESYETVEFTQDLVIHKASQTIDFEMISDKASDEISFELSALASSGLQVSYASSNTSIVLIEEATAFILGSGEVSVTASQNGNENYNAAEPVVQTFTVNLVLSVENPTSKAKIYPNPASNIIKINSEYSISSVSIIHSSGAKEEVELKENSFSIQHLAVGIYILRFNEGGMLHHLKVVKN